MLNRIAIGLLALITLGSFTFALVSATSETQNTAEVRITAKKLVDGRIEFGLQPRETDGWGERVLPRSRYFPANAQVDRWLSSSPVLLSGYTTLPIQTAIVYRIDSDFHSLTFSAEVNENTGSFNTLVTTKGVVNYSGISDPQLTLNCYEEHDGSGRLSAFVYVPWREHSESDIVFRATRYERDEWGQYTYDTVAEQLEWIYVPPSDWIYGSFAVTQDQMSRLKDFQVLSVEFRDTSWNPIVSSFNLIQALGTPGAGKPRSLWGI